MACCQTVLQDQQVRRQVEHLRDSQIGVVLSDSVGHKCRFGLVATFYPANDKKEIILSCQECGKRWGLLINRDSFRVQEV